MVDQGLSFGFLLEFWVGGGGASDSVLGVPPNPVTWQKRRYKGTEAKVRPTMTTTNATKGPTVFVYLAPIAHPMQGDIIKQNHQQNQKNQDRSIFTACVKIWNHNRLRTEIKSDYKGGIMTL